MKMLGQGLLLIVALSVAAAFAVADSLDIPLGKALFERRWVQAPASADSADGLGPLFNASACDSCHKSGGAARFIATDGVLGVGGLIVRLGDVRGRPDPYYGRQLQERAVPGLAAEARIFPELAASNGLPVMTARIELNGPAFAEGTRTDLRVAPSLAGRSLIERVAEDEVMALADPDDRDRDGISGRARMMSGGLGRLGLKATARSIHEQAADAAAFDMGLSSPGRPDAFGDCTPLERECLHMATGRSANMDGEEISDEIVSLIGAYVASLKPPRMHSDEPPEVFARTGCAQCHVPALKAAGGEKLPVFTDLLLHDLGEGLAGGFADDFATAGEWRTAPLIDLDPRGGKRRYLHDGRAESIEEAIGWHGGEAASARNRFEALPADDKAALISFVKSL